MILTLNLKEIKYREVKKVGNNEKRQSKYICTKNQIITDRDKLTELGNKAKKYSLIPIAAGGSNSTAVNTSFS